jgi:hypothetical protein
MPGIGSIWLGYPSPTSIREDDDEEFRVRFKVYMGNPLGEHITRIDAWMYNPNPLRLYFHDVDDFWNFGNPVGDHWEGMIWGAGYVIMDVYRSTGFRDVTVSFKIRCVWEQLVVFWYETRVTEFTFNKVYTFIQLPYPQTEDPIWILDDDTTAPQITITGNNFAYDSVLYDSAPYLSISGYTHDSSGTTQPEMKANGESPIWGLSQGNPTGITFTYRFPNPVELGSYTAWAACWDGDTDVVNDQLFTNITIPFQVADDDTTPPEITVDHSGGGTGTDGDPGYWTVSVEDPESDVDEIEVYIDDVLIGTTVGDYDVPSSIGEHTIRVNAINNDVDRGSIDQESEEIENTVTLTDDDTTPPTITITHSGGGTGTDGNPGYWTVSAEDPESGIGIVGIAIDGVNVGSSLGSYSVPTALGDHTIWVSVSNADFEWSGDLETDWKTNIATITSDDDTSPPIITITHSLGGYGYDIYPGYWTVSAVDPQSGIESIQIYVDGSFVGKVIGDYPVPNTPGTHEIMVFARNADLDRGYIDQESSSMFQDAYIYDDDTTPPDITIIHSGGGSGTDSDPGYWIVSAVDAESGIDVVLVEIDGVPVGTALGNYDVPNTLGTHTIRVVATNADDEWIGDQESDENDDTISIIDDDTTPPEITIVHSGGGAGTDGDPGYWTVSAVDPESGIGNVLVEINGIAAGTALGDYLVPNSLGNHTILVVVTNADNEWIGDQETTEKEDTATIIDDDIIPPDVSWWIGVIQKEGNDVEFYFDIDATDSSGIGSVCIEIEGFIFNDLNPHSLILPSGVYLMTVSITDNDNDRPNDDLTTYAVIVVDLIPPNTELSIDPYYDDGLGNIYVSSTSEFELRVTDDVSGVAHTYFSINGEPWIEDILLFDLAGRPDGIYIIEYYSVDNMGNVEDTKSTIVILVSLKVNSYLANDDSGEISYFDVIFTKDKSGGLQLVATNPGQIFYYIEVINDWPINIDTLTIDVSIPGDFVLKGANPIHVSLDAADITGSCVIDGTTLTVSDVPAGRVVSVKLHLDYGLKQTVFGSIDEFGMKNYNFQVNVMGTSGSPSESGEGIVESSSSSDSLCTHQKKTTAIAGYVYDSEGNPIVGALVEIWDSEGNYRTAITDENGFYYFLSVSEGECTVTATYSTIDDTQITIAYKDQLTQLDFYLLW